jgi:Ala-tRNA(Pro) deacylase
MEYTAEELGFCDDQKKKVFALLDDAGIKYQVAEHERVFTVETAERATGYLVGLHSKNLVLKGKKGQVFLVVCSSHDKVDLKRLAVQLSASSVRFAPKEVLRDVLGVLPGSVNPFCIAFDKKSEVELVVSKSLLGDDGLLLWFHPGANDATIGIRVEDLKAFWRSVKREAREIDM